MARLRVTTAGALPKGLLLALLLAPIVGACGPRPADPPPIPRGTALPPPGLEMPPRP